MPVQGPVTRPSLLEVAILLLPALQRLPPSLRAHVWQIDTVLSSQIVCGFERTIKALHGSPYVHHVAVEAAGEAVHVVAVEVHGGIGVLVIRRDATSLAASDLGTPPDDILHRHLFPECLEDAHAAGSDAHPGRTIRAR